MSGKNNRSAGNHRNGHSQGDSGRWISNNQSSSYDLNNGSSAGVSPWVQNVSDGAYGYGTQSYGSSSYANNYNAERNSYSFADRGYSAERGYNPVASGFAGASSRGQASSYKDPDSILKELGKCYLSTLSNGGAPGPRSGYGNYSQGNYRYAGGYGKSNMSPRSRGFQQGQGRTNLGQVKRVRESSQSGPHGAGGPGNKNSKKQRLNSGKQSESNQTKQYFAKPQVNGKVNKQPVNNAPKAKNGNKPGEMTKKGNNRQNAAQKRGQNVREGKKQKRNTDNKRSRPDGEQKIKPRQKGTGNKNRLTRRYNKLKENKFLDDNARVLVAFLRQSLEDVVPEDHMHSILVYYYLIKHRNAVQLYQYEVKTSLDKKFGTETDEETKKAKRDFLIAEKKQVLEELKTVNEEENNEELNGKLIDECIELVTKDVYPEELVPQDEDYIENPEVTRTVEDLTHEFQLQFLTFVYDQFGYSLPEKRGTLEQKLKFHLNNGIIPALLVELAQSTTLRLGDSIDLPDILAKGLVRWTFNSMFLRQKSENFNRAIHRRQVAQNEHLQTSVLDLLPPETKWSTKFVRDFSEVILMFDNIATIAKYKLIHYTPFINLSKEVKQGIFNELASTVYSEVFEILKNDVLPLRERTFEKMEGVIDDEDKTETQNSEGDNKDETSGIEKPNETNRLFG
uniref:Uncharacterized protein n=1 Tax=Cacopsylla melanoneura TaxID=428564 RepID=A0A8D8XYI6_9HEMI